MFSLSKQLAKHLILIGQVSLSNIPILTTLFEHPYSKHPHQMHPCEKNSPIKSTHIQNSPVINRHI